MAILQEAPDLGIPEVKPAIESIRGHWHQKMSPQRRHSLLQGRIWQVLSTWAEKRCEVGPEWRCYLLPSGEQPSSLVPDVSYFSGERMRPEFGELRETPTIAPDIAVEILSPGDRKPLLREKIELYLANGSQLVIVVSPKHRTVLMHEWRGMTEFAEPQVAVSEAYPTLRIDTVALFEAL